MEETEPKEISLDVNLDVNLGWIGVFLMIGLINFGRCSVDEKRTEPEKSKVEVSK